MLRQILNTLLAMILAFSGTSFGVLALHEILIPPKPDSWGAAGVLLILAAAGGVLSAVVAGIVTFTISTQTKRPIHREDLAGWSLGLVIGLSCFPVLSHRWHFPIRCLITAFIVPALMLAIPLALRLIVRRKSATEGCD
jgi:hypothetical protein